MQISASHLCDILPPKQCLGLRLPLLPLSIDFSAAIFLSLSTFFHRLSCFESGYGNRTLELHPCGVLGGSAFALVSNGSGAIDVGS